VTASKYVKVDRKFVPDLQLRKDQLISMLK